MSTDSLKRTFAMPDRDIQPGVEFLIPAKF
jgi:hypothetical protein